MNLHHVGFVFMTVMNLSDGERLVIFWLHQFLQMVTQIRSPPGFLSSS